MSDLVPNSTKSKSIFLLIHDDVLTNMWSSNNSALSGCHLPLGVSEHVTVALSTSPTQYFGKSILQIRKIIPVSDSTISKIQMWLKTYGDGFRTVLPKLKNKERAEKPESSESTWRRHKKRYAMYYWPELILKEIVKSANKREKKRLLDILSQLKEKTELTKELNAILRQNSYTT
jgi:hypothetical protein